jgi:hypothetical protein
VLLEVAQERPADRLECAQSGVTDGTLKRAAAVRRKCQPAAQPLAAGFQALVEPGSLESLKHLPRVTGHWFLVQRMTRIVYGTRNVSCNIALSTRAKRLRASAS